MTSYAFWLLYICLLIGGLYTCIKRGIIFYHWLVGSPEPQCNDRRWSPRFLFVTIPKETGYKFVSKMKKGIYLLIFLFFSFFTNSALTDNKKYIEAPYQCIVKKNFFKKRYGDITTNGRFVVYKIEFTNKDTKDHFIDISCFYLTDSNGIPYEIHTEATVVRQTLYEDFRIKDADVIGLNNKIIKAHFKTKGILVFEVPCKNEYQLNFRGYSK